MSAAGILDLASTGNASQVMRDMRVRSLYSPYYFAKVVLGYTSLTGAFHQREMEEFVSKWARGNTLQVVEWARAFFKTTCFTKSTAMWVVLPVCDEDTTYALDTLHLPESEWWLRTALHDQDATQLISFETISNAKKKLGEIKWHFEENELFRALFPEIAYTGSNEERPWNNESLRIRRAGRNRGALEGSFEAAGVGVALQSRHYTIIWEDDLVGEDARNGEGVMQKTIGWHQRLQGAFENTTKQVRFVIANRWGFDDLNSHIRANEPEFIFHTRSAWELDPETGLEDAVFPERYPMEALLKIKAKMSEYDFNCQYLNTPTLPGEKEVDLKKLHTYTVAEDGKMLCSCGKSFYLSQCFRYEHYDPYNAKGLGSKSRPSIVVIATTSDEHVLLIDYYIGKGGYGDVYKHIFNFNDRYRPRLFTYEDVGHQNMTTFHIGEVVKTAEYREKHKNFPRIEPCGTHGRAKEIRIRESLFPVINQKKFSYRTTQVAFAQQLDTFPNPALDHDYDLLDSLAQGPSWWRFPQSDDSQATRAEEDDAVLAQLGKPYCAGISI